MTDPPPPSRWPLLAGLTAAFGVLVFVVEVVPQAAEAAALFTAWRAEASRLDGVDPAERARLEAERDRLVDTSENALVALPGPGELSAVLAAVQEAADSSQVVVAGLVPGPRRRDAGLEVVPVRVSVRGDGSAGGGNAVGRFVSRLEQGEARLRVRAVEVIGPGLGPGPVTAHVDVEALLVDPRGVSGG